MDSIVRCLFALSICTICPDAKFNQHWSLVMGEGRPAVAVAERCYGSGAAIPSLRHAVRSKPLGPLCLDHFVWTTSFGENGMWTPDEYWRT